MATQNHEAARAEGLLLAGGAITSIQLGAALSESLFDRVGAAGSVFLRLLLAATVLWAVARPRLGSYEPRDVRAALALGVCIGAQSLLFFEAMDRIPFGVAVTIQFLGPLGVALSSSRRPLDVLWVTLVALGVVFLCLGEGAAGSLDALGVALAGVSAACWAGYILLTKHLGARLSGLDGLAISMAAAAAVSAPAGLAAGGAALLAPDVLLVAAGLSLLIPLLPYVCELAALRRLPSGLFALIMSLEPAVAVLLGFLLLGESLSATAMLGILLVLCGSAAAATVPADARAPRPARRPRRKLAALPAGEACPPPVWGVKCAARASIKML